MRIGEARQTIIVLEGINRAIEEPYEQPRQQQCSLMRGFARRSFACRWRWVWFDRLEFLRAKNQTWPVSHMAKDSSWVLKKVATNWTFFFLQLTLELEHRVVSFHLVLALFSRQRFHKDLPGNACEKVPTSECRAQITTDVRKWYRQSPQRK